MKRKSKAIRIFGFVVDIKTRLGVRGLRVEAWDKDLVFNDLVGSAATDERGFFQIEIDQSSFRELFTDRKPDLFFKLFRGDEPVLSTEDSTLWNLEREHTQIVIEVNIASLNQPARFAVKGQIRRPDRRPLAQAVVRAFDRDLRSEQLLGEAIADESGNYEILYTAARFRRAEKEKADLIVRVLDSDDAELGASEIVFNAPDSTRIDITIESRLSEYEQLAEALDPILENVLPADLTDEDIMFLAGESGIDRRRIEAVARGARLARETNIPTAIFYGFARKNLPLSLNQLLAFDPVVLGRALEAAVSEDLIPAFAPGVLDEITTILNGLRAEQSSPTYHELTGQLLTETTGAPLIGFTIRAFDLDAQPAPEELESTVTDSSGAFEIHYTTQDNMPPGGREAGEKTRRLRLHVVVPQGGEIYQTEVEVGSGDSLKIRVPASATPESSGQMLTETARVMGIELPQELISQLGRNGIHTLADVRKAGGISRLGMADHPSARALEAHANLSSLSDDLRSNAALIEKGYTSVAAIAAAPQVDFVEAVHEKLGDVKAAQMHVMAKAQTQFKNNLVTGMRAAPGSSHVMKPPNQPSTFPDGDSPSSGRPVDFSSLTCECEDCKAAVSPLAYLATLLDYAVTHLKKDSGPVQLESLCSLFHQPFDELPASCESLDREIRQVRICVEVLRSYMKANSLPPADSEAALEDAEKAYLLAAYTTLLNKIGTSYEEIRLARNATAAKRKALADRLGIASKHLSALFFDPAAKQPQPEAITEEALEKIFGLVDTTRDPLAAAETPALQAWRLEHLRTLWRRQDWPSDLYIEGETSEELKALPASVAFPASMTGKISFDVDDRLLIFKGVMKEAEKNELLSLSPEPLYQNAIERLFRNSRRLPIIDPDLIGPDDFRIPSSSVNANEPESDTNTAFDIWVKRRAWVDNLLAGLKQSHQDNGLDQILKETLGDPPPDLDALLNHLTEGDGFEKDEAVGQINKLDLTIESFIRLQGIRLKDINAKSDPKNEQVTPDEWQELYSILAQAVKVRLYPIWRDMEKAIEEQMGIALFGPKEFWLSMREPRQGAWPPETSVDSPFIDPEEVKLSDLPEPSAGKGAIDFWNSRRNALDNIKKDIKSKREKDGLDVALEYAFDLQTLGYDLASLQNDLNSADTAIVESAKAKLTNDLKMTVEDFNRLMFIKAKNDLADPAKEPKPAEWAELYAILTSARKRRIEFSIWIDEEKNAGMDVRYWAALKARLPLWRSTIEARNHWQSALQARSRMPLIDPDLIGPADLAEPSDGNPPFETWKARDEWITDTLSEFAGVEKTLNGLDTMVQTTLGVPVEELESLAAQRKAGNDITSRLRQLSLPLNAFTLVLRIRDLLSDQQPVLKSEWEDLYSILAQAQKHRNYADWQKEEREQGIILDPDYFMIPARPVDEFPAKAPAPLPAWRATNLARLDWQDILETRIEQEEIIIEGLRQVVSASEEEALPMLRDALIEVTIAGDDSFEAKAKSITDLLLIDARAGGCQKTTRIAQAIETIQAILVSTRTHQLDGKSPNPGLTLEDDGFDKAWQWIGSYATWKSAMFVFLYPENLLIPGLRRWQTPAFRKLADSLRMNRRMSAGQVCEAAREYADYFRDVCNLKPEVSCQTLTKLHKGDCHSPAYPLYSHLLYVFGREEVTNAVYWSAYDPVDESGYAQTFWETLPGLTGVVRLVGAVPYKIAPQQRFIFLFALTKKDDKESLVLIKRNLETGRWDAAQELDLPPDLALKTIVALQTRSEDSPPRLVIHSHDILYLRSLNSKGSDWEPSPSMDEGGESGDEWDYFRFNTSISFPHVTELYAVLEFNYACVCLNSLNNLKVVRLYRDTLGWHVGSVETILDQNNFLQFQGALLDSYGLYIFYKKANGAKRYALIEKDNNTVIQKFADKFGPISMLDHIIPRWGVVAGYEKSVIAYQRAGNEELRGFYRCDLEQEGDDLPDGMLEATKRARITPRVNGPFDIVEKLSEAELQLRRLEIEQAFSYNEGSTSAILSYLEEAYYFVPVHIALQLQAQGHYVAALDWFRTVYDYSVLEPDRKIYYGLEMEESLEAVYEQADNWYLDPINPHSIAATRANSYSRFTLLSLIRCFLEFADSEFTQDTAESVPRARTLYMTALRLLDAPELAQGLNPCDELIGMLNIEVGDPRWVPVWDRIKSDIASIATPAKLSSVVAGVKAALTEGRTWDARFAAARQIIAKAKAELPGPPTYGSILAKKSDMASGSDAALLAQPSVVAALQRVGALAGQDFLRRAALASGISRGTLEQGAVEMSWLGRKSDAGGERGVASPTLSSGGAISTGGVSPGNSNRAVVATPSPSQVYKASSSSSSYYVPTPSFDFCIPQNPLLKALRLRAELNLYKLRNCRNITGMERQLEPYAAATDTDSGLPMIGAGGQLVLPGASVLRPTAYRYAALTARAKELAQLAAQAETAMLSAIEKRDAESYHMLIARQDVRLTRAGVRLQDLRVKEAEGAVKLAELQRERTEIEVQTFKDWIEAGPSIWEEIMISEFKRAADARKSTAKFQAAVEAADALTTAATAGLTAAAASAQAAMVGMLAGFAAQQTVTALEADVSAQIASIKASYEIRAQEWELQKKLAEQDTRIGSQMIKSAQDHVRVVGQERLISEMQAEHAETIVEFLANKFTNVELYDWMSDTLEQVYSFFLWQATATAQLAANQLAFERQEIPPPFIQTDYWAARAAADAISGNAPDRRGLTGSARLIQDILQLDQYAFDTNKRKLQLVKTISLARLFPVEFQRFRQTGVMTFATPMEMFDRDFPGHYLRLIKRVRTSVIALVPPATGICATLTSNRISRVVIGGDIFQTTIIRHGPDQVALSSPYSATGVFELEAQSDMLLPFENIGVATNWEFRMLKAANPFDYNTIADVLITIEYTALNSFDYYQQVIQTLKPTLSVDRSFSFRHELADQWYDLHNPEQTATPLAVRFTTRRSDFLPNLEDMKVEHLVLYFARTPDTDSEIEVSQLKFIEKGGLSPVAGAAVTIGGLISTRQGNAGSWTTIIGKTPVGEWELALPNTAGMIDLLKKDKIEDIFFVITYSGRTPEYPV